MAMVTQLCKYTRSTELCTLQMNEIYGMQIVSQQSYADFFWQLEKFEYRLYVILSMLNFFGLLELSLDIVGGNVKDVAAVENYLAVPKILSIKLPYDPAIALLGTYPGELKTYVHAKTF